MELAERQVTANEVELCPLKSPVSSICVLSRFCIQGLIKRHLVQLSTI